MSAISRLPIAALLLTCLLVSCEKNTTDRAGNHLVGSASPYLLQHAGNPVDWYPWGEEALTRAADAKRLLVVSVGYAACHWCHVMEEESFSDSTVAALMNDNFVSIKVDREERPDIDKVYMDACNLTNESGCGWPLNTIALPDGRPIFSGTYFSREQWLALLNQFQKQWTNDPANMENYATRLTAGESAAARAQLLERVDFEGGGITGAPKFPTPILYDFLLAEHHYSQDASALEAVTTTLDAMAAGGIYDQLAGGFARYSTDADWRVPHFEKMLYDNAQLVSLYAKAYQKTDKELYADVVRETINFVETSLSHPAGIFYTSLDADTEGEEGGTYVWTAAEIDATLDPEKAEDLKAYFNVTPAGNWEGTNILHRSPDAEPLSPDLKTAARQLLEARNQRPQPRLDDKSLTALNALMITAYADAYRALGTESYRDRAVEAATFLRDNLIEEDGRLHRNYKDGQPSVNAFLDDYASLAEAALNLYQITFDADWLDLSARLLDYTENHFYDPASGLYRYTSDLDPPLVAPQFPVVDQAIPSPNSVLARTQYRLGLLLADEDRKERAADMLNRVRERLNQQGPIAYANWANLYLDLLHPTYEVAILGADAGAMMLEMANEYHPNALYLGGTQEGEMELLANKLVPGETTIYVCLDRVCQLPVNDVDRAIGQLKDPG